MIRTTDDHTVPELTDVAPEVATTIQAVARGVARLAAILSGPATATTAGRRNASGDAQTPLDLVAHDLFVDVLREAPVRAVASEEADDPVLLDRDAPLAVAIDPLDGSSNVAINAPLGTIFSIVDATATDPGAVRRGADDHDAPFLGDGSRIVASGLALFGPSTMLAIAVAGRVGVYRLDSGSDRYEVETPHLEVPIDGAEYAINASNYRHWAPEVRRYVDDLVAGSEGPRGTNTNTRWVAALVADAYRILVRGGIYLYPADRRDGYEHGRLRLLYEAYPVAHLIETAGGSASDGERRILDMPVSDLHQRTPLVFGSAREVERVADYRTARADGDRAPLFTNRGLFRS
ncbi:MAG: class 1 fructose-bisphosphatase [Acidimicrobiaceae bacterium]|nr:class 1 fructose-bisphosphatase [Acidimicrobiaceae bacterium]